MGIGRKSEAGKAEIRPSASDRETKHTDIGANSCLMGGHGRSLTLAYRVRDEQW